MGLGDFLKQTSSMFAGQPLPTTGQVAPQVNMADLQRRANAGDQIAMAMLQQMQANPQQATPAPAPQATPEATSTAPQQQAPAAPQSAAQQALVESIQNPGPNKGPTPPQPTYPAQGRNISPEAAMQLYQMMLGGQAQSPQLSTLGQIFSGR